MKKLASSWFKFLIVGNASGRGKDEKSGVPVVPQPITNEGRSGIINSVEVLPQNVIGVGNAKRFFSSVLR